MLAVIDGIDEFLRCPNCGGDHLHQGTVEIFNREEDKLANALLIPTNGEPQRGDPNRNPSSRRQGLRIGFYCEECSNLDFDCMWLTIAQHKGTTYVRWED